MYTMTVLKLIRVIIVLALLGILVASRHSSARLGAIFAARYTSSSWLVWATSRLVNLFRVDGLLLTKEAVPFERAGYGCQDLIIIRHLYGQFCT